MLQSMIAQLGAAAAKAPNDATAQYSLALGCSFLAEVMIEQHERKPARQIAEQGIKAAEKAVVVAGPVARVAPIVLGGLLLFATGVLAAAAAGKIGSTRPTSARFRRWRPD